MAQLRILAAMLMTLLVAAVFAQSKPAEPLKPLDVVVVDSETGKPISTFDYFYRVEAPSGYQAGGWEWTAVNSETGTVRLDLPISCQLTFAARAPGYIYDTLYIEDYPIRSDDAERRIKHALQRGITVTGRVIDAATGQPVAGARVSPTVFHNPTSDPDRDRSVFSDSSGRFEISGIDPSLGSVAFEHTDYLETRWYTPNYGAGTTTEPPFDITVELEAGEAIFGVVKGPGGKPIEGATVDSGDGKDTQTAADGTFRIRGVRSHWDYGDLYVSVRKAGYMRYWKTPHEMPNNGFQITLEPLFEIRGRVVDSDGQPVKRFSVMAGPGKAPAKFECAYAQVVDDEGRFSIAIDTQETWRGGTAEDGEHIEPRHWLAVWTGSHAVWEDLVQFDRKGAAVTVTLQPGVAVSAHLSGIPASFEGGEAVLIPERPPREYSSDETAPQKAGTLTTAIATDGTLRFVHVRPDNYILRISGHGITPCTVAVEVPNENLPIGPIEVQAVGRIVGQIFCRDGQPWGFADGVLYHPALGDHEARYFKAAEDGRFTLEDVPAGAARVGAQYRGGDIIWADLVNVNIVPGGEIEVVINNPDRSRDIRFRIEIGDGSESQRQTGTGMAAKRLVDNVTTRDPAFHIELESLASGCYTLPDTSDWYTLPDMADPYTPDADGLITLPDVPAGEYRLRVFDWLMSRGFCEGLLYETQIEVRPGVEPIRIPLGAATITGQLNVSNKIRRMPQVIAVETQGRTQPRRARCDNEGNFCVRYLPPGEYVLYGHEDANGWCRLPVVGVSNDITDVGEHPLAAGATIRGEVRLVRPTQPPTAVRATDANGVTLEALDFEGQNGEDFAISNLWPGTWTLTLERNGEVLAQKIASLDATEVVTVDLIVE